MLFKVTNKDNRGNAIFIQGAYSRNSSNDVAAIIFQNYDEDTKKVYNIAGISARDPFGTLESNGEGDMLFLTNTNGSDVSEQMRLKSTGQLCIGSSNALDNTALLSISGNATIGSNFTVLNSTQLLGTLTVNSNVTLCNSINVLGTLITSSNATFCNDITGYGSMAMSSNMVIGGDQISTGNIASLKNITASNDLFVYRNTSLGLGTNLTTTTINGRAIIQTTQSNACLTANQLGTGNVMQLLSSNTPIVTVSNNGFVGIGTSNASRRLDVNGDINFEGMLYQNNVAFPREPMVQTFNKVNTNSKDYTVLLSWVNDLSFSNIRKLSTVATKAYVLPGYLDKNLSNMSYSLRVYDFTNNRVLAESTLSNQNPSLVQLALSNLSSNTLTELELHGKVGVVGSNLCVENLLFRYS